MNASEPESSTNSEDDWLGVELANRYRVETVVGRGGMGIVYRGRHLELGKAVAIKRLEGTLSRHPLAQARFRDEAIAASRINSPHVVQIFDWGLGPRDCAFIVMELLAGKNLRELLKTEGRLEPPLAARLAVQILEGLETIHQAKILHGDLKPENVFLCDSASSGPFVKLLDFGISRTLEDPADAPSRHPDVVLGTAAYMSPEQATGEAELDERADLYSLGAIVYEALCGRVPHEGPTTEAILVERCTREADDVRLHCPLVPKALAAVLAKALMRERTERFASAREFREALLESMPALRNQLSTAATPSVATGTHPESLVLGTSRADGPEVASNPHPRALWILLGFLVLAMTAYVVMAIQQKRELHPPSALSLASTLEPVTAASAPEPPNSESAQPAPRTEPVPSPSATTQVAPTRRSPMTAPKSADERSGVVSGLKLKRSMP